MAGKSAVLFVNGDIEDVQALAGMVKEAALCIAVDGGLRWAKSLGVLPDVLIGDLDSVEPGAVEEMRAAGVRVVRYPVEKDDTDLELAIRLAIDEGCDPIRLLGAIGGRIDQTLGNLFLLAQPDLAVADVRAIDPGREIFLIRGQAEIEGSVGDTVSLLPLIGEAHGVSTDGLYYPLQNETLYPYRTRGISNVMTGARATVAVREGVLLCVHASREYEG